MQAVGLQWLDWGFFDGGSAAAHGTVAAVHSTGGTVGESVAVGYLGEFIVLGELCCLPGIVGALAVALTVVIDFHGVFLGFMVDNKRDGDGIAVYLNNRVAGGTIQRLALPRPAGGAQIVNYWSFVKGCGEKSVPASGACFY